MNEAATQDVREMTFEPVLSKLLHGGKAPNARDAKMLALLDQWRRDGGSRLDRTDASGVGKITVPGRSDHGHRVAAAGQRLGVVGAGPEAVRRSWQVSSAVTTSRPAASTPAGTSTWTRTCARSWA